MPRIYTSGFSGVVAPEPLASADERERHVIQAVVGLARSLRDERDRLAKRLYEVDLELNLLASKLDAVKTPRAPSSRSAVPE